MNTLDTLKLALDFVERHKTIDGIAVHAALSKAIEQAEQQEPEAVRSAWMAGYTEGERDVIEQAEQPISLQCANCQVTIDCLNDKVMYLMKQAEQAKPVAVVSGYYGGQCVILPTNPAMLFNSGTALYTAPPHRQPLSQYAIDRIVGRLQVKWPDYFDLDVATQLVRAIEQAHGIKENT